MATAYGADLPANMFTPAPDTIPRQFEHQFAKCSDEFCAFLNHRDEFSPSEAMRKAGCTLLSIVPGVMLRMSARAAGLGGVTSNNAMHALLLCADGQEGMARDFVITNREGLPPLPEERASKLLLHTVAVQVEPMKLNGAVTLFAQGGKPGEPIQSPGSWVWRSSAAIVPIEKVMENFFVMSCGVESTLPKRCSMRKFMQTHMQRSMDMFNSTFDRADINAMLKTYCAKRKSPDAPLEALTEEDRLSMVAIGIDMNSKRLCLGQTITHLMTHTSCKSALLDMLIKTSTRVGLSASLESMFASCVSSMEKEDENIKNHKLDVERLKRVTDAALVMALSRKQEKAPVIHTSADKVRTLMKAFSLQAGRTTCSIKDMADMDSSVARSMVCTVYEAYEGRMCKNAPHADQVESLFCAGAEILVATCKALKVCMVEPGEEKDAFVIMHGDSKEDTVRVFRVGSLGDPEACGIGPAFESRMPVVLIIKFKTENSCLVTPLVRKPA
jgi:ABC-type transporter Mla MlaB component